MIRCPHCLKATHVKIDDKHVLFVGYDLKMTIETYPITFGSKVAEVTDLVSLAAHFKRLNIEFTDHDHLKCPSCGKESSFSAYVNAWDHPEDTHPGGADQLCWCGGELWYDKIPGTTKYAMVCEKCEWVKPAVIIDGG